MQEYEFECPHCGRKQSCFFPMEEVPEFINCPFHIEPVKMYRVYYCNFILKNDGWPSKEFRQSFESRKATEETEKRDQEIISSKKEADEVLKERRKGTKAFKEYQKHYSKKIKRVRDNRSKGLK